MLSQDEKDIYTKVLAELHGSRDHVCTAIKTMTRKFHCRNEVENLNRILASTDEQIGTYTTRLSGESDE